MSLIINFFPARLTKLCWLLGPSPSNISASLSFSSALPNAGACLPQLSRPTATCLFCPRSCQQWLWRWQRRDFPSCHHCQRCPPATLSPESLPMPLDDDDDNATSPPTILVIVPPPPSLPHIVALAARRPTLFFFGEARKRGIYST